MLKFAKSLISADSKLQGGGQMRVAYTSALICPEGPANFAT